jgi:hypothetical protein
MGHASHSPSLVPVRLDPLPSSSGTKRQGIAQLPERSGKPTRVVLLDIHDIIVRESPEGDLSQRLAVPSLDRINMTILGNPSLRTDSLK